MHSKRECNYLLATHGAAVAVACTHYGNNVGCEYCSYAIAVTTSIKQLRPLQLLRLLQQRLLAQQPYVTTPATPSWHTSTVSTLMACTGAMYVTAARTGGNVRYGCMRCLPLLPLHLTAHKAGANCKLQTANCQRQTANCNLCCYGSMHLDNDNNMSRTS